MKITYNDLISRQAAIDAIRRMRARKVYLNKLPSMIDKTSALRKIERLPSAEPQIVRCGECKNWWGCIANDDGEHYCDLFDIFMERDDFCSHAIQVQKNED